MPLNPLRLPLLTPHIGAPDLELVVLSLLRRLIRGSPAATLVEWLQLLFPLRQVQ